MAIACVEYYTGYNNNDGGSAVTSTAFNVSTDDLIVVCGHSDQTNDTTDVIWTISDNQTPDLAYTIIAERDGVDGIAGAVIAYYHRVVSPLTGLQITLTVGAGAAADSPAIKVYKLTGYDTTTIIGGSTEGDWTSSGQQTANITAATNGIGILVATDWSQLGVPTSVDTTETGFDTPGDISGMSGFRTLVAAALENADMTKGPTAGTPSGNYLWFEIREAAGGGGGRTSNFITLLGVS